MTLPAAPRVATPGRDLLSPSARIGIGIALLFLLVAIPLWGSTLIILRATEVIVFIVAFSGLHVLSGRLGLISVGHGAFIGIGAVTAAHGIDDLSLPYLSAPVIGAIGAGLFGLVIGVPSLRLPGAYLALLTLAVAMVLPIGLRRLDGPLGYRVDGDILPPDWTGLSGAENDVWQYLLVLIGGLVIMGLVHYAIQGRFTRSLIAVRDEPTAAAAFGVNTSRVHLTGVAVSAGLAGAAGGLSLYATPLVSGEQYPFSMSVAMFALMLALGASRLWTSVPAAVILIMLPEILIRTGYPIWEPIVYAVILLIMTRVSRGRGLTSLLEQRPTETVVSTEPTPAPYRPKPFTPSAPNPGAENPWLLTPEPPAGES